ncbi:S9 family peptidase [Phototrophicus methaneseepsis]|uniref:S9 family peptidase n=1 Tax=Phototrophicus methaneseepsis TaxID=2710758 RepID=A0A7S8IFD3_9CHLR|nr:S9 family peptidase [Phototrophicus methaneseepsis]QPC84615.1 S9 family peptidase [Phototrophicus methaneseepsis]
MADTTPIGLDDYFKLKFLSGAALSPDGTQVVYGVSHYDEEKDADIQTLWLADLSSGEKRQLTPPSSNAKSPSWSPDGTKVGFISDREGKPQIFVLPIDGGEGQKLTSIDQGVREGPVWSPDGEWVAFTSGWSEEDMPDLTKPYRVTRHVYRTDGIGYIDPAVQQVYVIPTTGGEAKQLTDDTYINTGLKWSPDSSKILYSAAFPTNTHKFSPLMRTITLDGDITTLLEGWGDTGAAAWIDDTNIAFIGQVDGLPIGTKTDLWVTDVTGKEPENRTPSLLEGVGSGLQGDIPTFNQLRGGMVPYVVGDKAYVWVQTSGMVHIYEVALTGDESYEAVVTGERSCHPQGLANGKLLYAVSSFTNPLELYISELDGSNEEQVTDINDDFLSQKLLPEVVNLRWSSVDDVEVEGWYLKPTVGEAPYPTILYIHGGPHSAFGNVFSFDFQMLIGAGYGVLAINHRASLGYGNDFSTAIKGDWGNLDYNDLMTGVDYAIEQGLADADKLGVCGLSGGGNLSTWIVGQTDRFKAAIPENPVTNWLSFYGVSDIGIWFSVEELGGHPHEIPETYVKCSPITYAYRCTTPTLLVQGEHDYRCPAEQSEQFYAVLKANGCTVEMLRLPNSPHAGAIVGAPPLRRAQNEAMMDWFNRYVLEAESE